MRSRRHSGRTSTPPGRPLPRADTSATKRRRERATNAQAQLAEGVKQQAQSLANAMAKLTLMTQAAQRLATVPKGKCRQAAVGAAVAWQPAGA